MEGERFMAVTLNLLDPNKENKKFGDSLHGVIEIAPSLGMRFEDFDD